MPLNRMLQAAMQASNQKQAGDPNAYANQMSARNAQMGGARSNADQLRNQIESIKRKIMEYKVQAARSPEMAQEMEAKIAFAMDKLVQMEDNFDRIYGAEGQRFRNDERVQQAEQAAMAKQDRMQRSQQQSQGSQGMGQMGGGGGETGPGGMTQDRWGGMSKQDRQAFLNQISQQAGHGGAPDVGRPWWMTLSYGAEGPGSAGATSTPGMQGGNITSAGGLSDSNRLGGINYVNWGR